MSYYCNVCGMITWNLSPRSFFFRQIKSVCYKITWKCLLALTIHLKSVGLKKLLVSICMTRIVAHVGRSHLGDVQRTVVAVILPEKETETLITQRKIWWWSCEGGLVLVEDVYGWKWTMFRWECNNAGACIWKDKHVSLCRKNITV